MTSALATMRVDYDQVKIKDLKTSNNRLLNKRRKKQREAPRPLRAATISSWGLGGAGPSPAGQMGGAGPAPEGPGLLLSEGMVLLCSTCCLELQDGTVSPSLLQAPAWAQALPRSQLPGTRWPAAPLAGEAWVRP